MSRGINSYQEQARQIYSNLSMQEKLDTILNKINELDNKIIELTKTIDELKNK